MRARSSSLFFSVPLLLLGALACTEATPTQVLIVFTADAPTTALTERLHIEVTNQEGIRRVWDIDLREGEPTATRFPVTLPLVPRGGDATRTYDVVADAIGASGVIARQRVRSRYVADELREIRVRFSSECSAVLCDRGTTCRGGTCVDACAEPAPRGDPSFHACALPDAGVLPDAGIDETGCDDRYADALFCDGFEAPLPGAWSGLSERQGFLTRLAAPVYRGAFALEARSTDVNAFVYTRADLTDVTTDLFVRLYAYLPSGQEVVDLNLIYAGEPSPPYGGIILGLRNGGAAFARSMTTDREVVTGDTPLAWDRWVCLEAHALLDEVGMIELWVDGVSRGRLEGIDTRAVLGVAGMNAGIANASASQPPVRVLIDEVIASTTRIGCD